MGLFEKIFKKQKALQSAKNTFQTLTAYQPVFTSWGGKIYESELVRAAIDAKARNIAKLKVEILGSARPSLKARLKKGPNPWMTWYQFLYRLDTVLEVHNTAFAIPIFGDYGEITGMFPALPTQCSITEDSSGKEVLIYTFLSGKQGACYLDECAILTRFQYQNDFFGENNFALDSTMSLIDIQEQGIKEAIKSTSTYRFMAKVSNFSKAQDLARERMRFSRENFGEEAEATGVLLFPNTYSDIKQIDAKPWNVDAEQKKIIQQNVYNYFGVNEDVLQNKCFGDSWSAFYEGAIEPFAIQFSEALTKMLFTDREMGSGNGLMLTANRLQFLSNADKLEMSSAMADRGIMSINEVREIWNLPPVEGGDQRTIRGEYYLMDGKDKDNAEGNQSV